jgi:hypothetical protein
MRALNRSSLPVWVATSIAAAGLIYWHASPKLAYAGRDFTTGYILLGLMVFLALYNGRKKLSMLPLGKASTWLTLHLAGGIFALVVFRLHVGSLWPIGPMHLALAALFYAVCVSGVIGYGLQLWMSRRLAQAGGEIIFERIPAEIAAIRAQAEKAVLKAAEESGNDTLGRDYLQTLAWYFAQPRFFWSCAMGGFGRRSENWLQRNLHTIGRYLSEAERAHLEDLSRLGAEKRRVDVQYAMQSLLKRWTIFHVPLAAAMLTLAVWHLILVEVFGQ